jgi:uncharacterized protein (TIGR00106 family)
MIVEMSILPVGAGSHMHEPMAAVFAEIKKSGLRHEVHVMGTNIEGEWEEVATLVQRSIDAVHELGVEQVSVALHLSDRRDGTPNTLARRRLLEETLGVRAPQREIDDDD